MNRTCSNVRHRTGRCSCVLLWAPTSLQTHSLPSPPCPTPPSHPLPLRRCRIHGLEAAGPHHAACGGLAGRQPLLLPRPALLRVPLGKRVGERGRQVRCCCCCTQAAMCLPCVPTCPARPAHVFHRVPSGSVAHPQTSSLYAPLHPLPPGTCTSMPACMRTPKSATTSTWSRCGPIMHLGGCPAAPICAAQPLTCGQPMVRGNETQQQNAKAAQWPDHCS